MPRENYTDVTILLDRSYSMDKIKEGTVGGINAFIEEQKKVPGDGCWSLFQFDTRKDAGLYEAEFPEKVFECVPQENVKRLELEQFQPRGNTALIDAACLLIDRVGRRFDSMVESARPSNVVFVIVTDGEENSSTTYMQHHLRERISHQREKYKWQFVFLGANIDAKSVAGDYGISADAAFRYDHTNVGTESAYGVVSRGLRSWKLDGIDSDLLIDPVVPPGTTLPGVEVNVNVTNKK